MSATSKHPLTLFAVVFKTHEDPTPEQQRELLASLPRCLLLDELPGSILVKGEARLVEEALVGNPLWSLIPARAVEILPSLLRHNAAPSDT